MAKFDKSLADFVKTWGEDAVETALKLYVSQRERSKTYAEGRKKKNAAMNVLFEKAKDPAVAAKLRELGINISG